MNSNIYNRLYEIFKTVVGLGIFIGIIMVGVFGAYDIAMNPVKPRLTIIGFLVFMTSSIISLFIEMIDIDRAKRAKKE